MKVEFDNADARLDLWQKETIMQSVSETLTRNVRSCDLLGRCDPQIFGVLFPQTTVEKARMICDRLRFLLQNRHDANDGIQLKITFGLSEFSPEQQETAPGPARAGRRTARANNTGILINRENDKGCYD